MSANRKLLGEIQQVLKKVEEGVAIFDEIWEKVYAAEQQALKEKYEADLKKEIKKLQRLRDQIKTWIGSNEIKDKTQLMEARKIIETKMEQFKVCEKDTKTKAYSKEGLAREARLDPKEALKEEKRQWLNDCLDKLNDLIDSVEAEREKVIGSAKGKTKNKEALEKFDNRVQKHKWHMAKLELIIKLLDNDDLEPSLVSGIQDSLDYYIESAVDDDGALGVEHEFDIYEDLELDRVTTAAPTFDLSPRGVPAKDEESASPTAGAAATAAESTENVAEAESSTQPAPAKKAAVPAAPAATAKASKTEPAAPVVPAAKPVPAAAATANAKISPKVTPVAATASAAAKVAPAAAAKVSPKPAALADDHSDAAKDTADSTSSAPASTVPATPAATGMSWAAHAASAVPAAPAPVPAPVITAAPTAGASKPVPATVPAAGKSAPTNGAPAPAPAVVSEPVVSVAVADSPAPAVVPAPMAIHVPSPVSSVGTAQASPASSVSAAATTPPPPPLQQQSKPNPELVNIMNQLKQSMVFSPEAMELDKQSSLLQYNPRNVYPNTHPTFPSVPQFTTQTEIADLFERLPMDTLFFVFYFQQGTYQQYLAAKQLKKHSWRFHKKYMTWFQRHEEPKVATEDYEEGTYVYFDYESGWCQRIKSEFKFEYAYLEDELGGAPGEA